MTGVLTRCSLLVASMLVAFGGMVLVVSAQAVEPEFVPTEIAQEISEPPKEPKHIHMLATAYCSCKICCGRRARGITKTGTRATHGTVAVDPKVLDLKSTITIRGMGEFRCEDTGRKIKGNRIDIWKKTHWAAQQFGKKHVVVELEG